MVAVATRKHNTAILHKKVGFFIFFGIYLFWGWWDSEGRVGRFGQIGRKGREEWAGLIGRNGRIEQITKTNNQQPTTNNQ